MKRLIYKEKYDANITILENIKKFNNGKLPIKYNDREIYDDITLYINIEINGDLNTFFKDILNNFPEYYCSNSGYNNFIITPIGFYIFYGNEDNFIVYDIFDHEAKPISEIKQDITLLKNYNYLNNPFNIRKINIKNGCFVPDKSYRKINNENMNEYIEYGLFNTDRLYNYNYGIIDESDNHGFYKMPNRYNSLLFSYKPTFYIKTSLSNFELKNFFSIIDIVKFEGTYSTSIVEDGDTSYFTINENEKSITLDLTKFECKENEIYLKIGFETIFSNCNGYIEVI